MINMRMNKPPMEMNVNSDLSSHAVSVLRQLFQWLVYNVSYRVSAAFLGRVPLKFDECTRILSGVIFILIKKNMKRLVSTS